MTRLDELPRWFTEDFTLAELKTLRAKERLPQVRPDNTRYDGRFQIPTLVEVLQLVREESKRSGRTIGVYPETKHPTYFDSIGLSLEGPLVRTLGRFGLDRKRSKVIIQSFETANLRDLDTMAPVQATTEPSRLVSDAHRRGLVVHVWTLRDENTFMATNFRRGANPIAKGDVRAEVVALLEAGVDGIFADYPDSVVDARDEWLD